MLEVRDAGGLLIDGLLQRRNLLAKDLVSLKKTCWRGVVAVGVWVGWLLASARGGWLASGRLIQGRGAKTLVCWRGLVLGRHPEGIFDRGRWLQPC